MLQGDIGAKGSFLKSTKRNLRGFSDIDFQHQASSGDTGINLLNLNPPTGVVNPSPAKLGESLKEGNLILHNGEGRKLTQGIDFALSGTSITFSGFTALDGEIFDGTIKNAPQQGAISLLDGVPLSPREFLSVGQDTFNLGRAVPVPPPGGVESIIVMRNRQQEVFTDDYTFIDPNNTGFAQVIQLNKPGEILPGGFDEFIQVFANGFIVEKQPTGVNAKLDQLRGQTDRIIDELVTQHAIDPNTIRLGAPTNEDLKFFGDTVNELRRLVDIVIPITDFTKTKTQTKILASDIVELNTTIAALTFNNLVIGKKYKVWLQGAISSPDANNVTFSANHDGSVLCMIENEGANTSDDNARVGTSSPPFIATANTVTFVTAGMVIGGSADILAGNGTLAETFVVIEELPNHEITTDFT